MPITPHPGESPESRILRGAHHYNPEANVIDITTAADPNGRVQTIVRARFEHAVNPGQIVYLTLSGALVTRLEPGAVPAGGILSVDRRLEADLYMMSPGMGSHTPDGELPASAPIQVHDVWHATCQIGRGSNIVIDRGHAWSAGSTDQITGRAARRQASYTDSPGSDDPLE